MPERFATHFTDVLRVFVYEQVLRDVRSLAAPGGGVGEGDRRIQNDPATGVAVSHFNIPFTVTIIN